jgi:hypothetical protein
VVIVTSRGAAILDKPEGKKFIEDLWKETVEDLAKIDTSLGTYATAQWFMDS